MKVLLLMIVLPVLSLGQNSCPPPRINRTMNQIMSNTPLHINFLPRSGSYLGDATLIDNICFTSLPLTDCLTTMIGFVSIVYTNNTNRVDPYIYKCDYPGFLQYTSPRLSFNDTVFAADNTTDYVYQTTSYNGCVFGVTPTYGQYPTQFQSIINSFGYGNSQYLFLPMKLPTQCVTSLICSDNCRGCHSNNPQTRVCRSKSCPTNNHPSNNCPSSNCPTNTCPNNNFPNNNCPNNNCPSSNYPSYNYPTSNCPTCNQSPCGSQNY